jgi:hypothetical protein
LISALVFAAAGASTQSLIVDLMSQAKKRARLNIIGHVLEQIPYGSPPRDPVVLPAREKPRATACYAQGVARAIQTPVSAVTRPDLTALTSAL